MGVKTPWANRMTSDRPRHERDFYETPPELAEQSLRYLLTRNDVDHTDVIDPGCGTGVWGRAMHKVSPNVHIVGIDLEPSPLTTSDFSYGMILDGDYLADDIRWFSPADLVIGNPPYALAEQFVRKSMEYVIPGGHIYFLLQLNFLGSRKRQTGLFKEFPLKQVHVLTRRPSFFSPEGKSNGTDAVNYAMYLWQKGYEGETTMKWLYWNYETKLASG